MFLIEIEKADLADFAALQADASLGLKTVETDSLDASGVELVKVLVPPTTAAITAVTTVVVQLIRSRRHIKIKQKGVEIVGLSADNAAKVLQELSKK